MYSNQPHQTAYAHSEDFHGHSSNKTTQMLGFSSQGDVIITEPGNTTHTTQSVIMKDLSQGGQQTTGHNEVQNSKSNHEMLIQQPARAFGDGSYTMMPHPMPQSYEQFEFPYLGRQQQGSVLASQSFRYERPGIRQQENGNQNSHAQNVVQQLLFTNRMPAPSPTDGPNHFPYPSAFLEKQDLDPPRLGPIWSLPLHDYIFSDYAAGKPLSFTAVELITFLPHLCRSKWIVTRLINGGMQNTTHLEIHTTHRHCNMHQDSVTVSTIANGYLDGMRGPGWRLRPKEQQGTWTRKGHKPPKDWVCSLEMSGFQPDRLIYGTGSAPKPVPFSALLEGVKEIPTGFDAADLTKAIKYALGNPLGEGREWMFPTHLAEILDRVGRTQATNAQQDSAIAYRYGRVREKKQASLRTAVKDPKDGKKDVPKAQHDHVFTAGDSQPQAYNPPALQMFHAVPLPPALQQGVPPRAQAPQLETSLELHQVHPMIPPPMIEEQPIPDFRFTASSPDSDVTASSSIDHAREYGDEMEVSTHNSGPTIWSPNGLLEDPVLSSMRMTAEEYVDLFDEAAPTHLPLKVLGPDVSYWEETKPELSSFDILLASDCDQSEQESYRTVVSEYDMGDHHPSDLLRDCVEADDALDLGMLAEAARAARHPKYVRQDWCVQDMLLLADQVWTDGVMGE